MATFYPSSQELRKIIRNLDPDSLRLKLIQSSKRFKSNWVDLGEFLTKVAAEKLFTEWGYKSFEDYCRIEIRIKKATAIKLTNAFFFISEEGEPFFQGYDSDNIPDLDAVCVLHQAKQDNDISPEDYQELRVAALGLGRTGQTLHKRYKGMIGNEPDEKEIRDQSYNLVARLKEKLSHLPDLPEEYLTHLEEIQNHLQSTE